ncbi:MAG: T9SS type A sorting domain-containing protein [Saprospiraceae bacterium]|nr:T9SS type A sorting domain-containing protein [Saprospiraceae bacterium]
MKHLFQASLIYRLSSFNSSDWIVTRSCRDNQTVKKFFYFIKVSFVFISFFLLTESYAQSVTVALPTDGSSATTIAPQGALRYQRGFYLITPREMSMNGLKSGDTISCIGFTIGSAQDDTTYGAFKVYLQNTVDTVSRLDTAWTVVPGILNNYFHGTGLFPASYEWQVKTNCSGYSTLHQFSNSDLYPCQPPSNLFTDSITDATARLTWVSPASTLTDFFLEYKTSVAANWIGLTTTNDFYFLGGLLPNTAYQWRIKTKCATDSSVLVYETFNTINPNYCSPPDSLTVDATTNTVAKLSWKAAIGADYYNVRFRRAGTSPWNGILSFADSIMISFGLDAGTNYEWQVRSNCGTDSAGSYIPGPIFTTTGTSVCYAPEIFSIDSLTNSTAKFTWDSMIGATSYELRYRPKGVISWPSATIPMALVHNDSITIPDKIGPYDVAFEGLGIDTFVYTGAGLYIAWEYKDSLGPLSSTNVSLATAANTTLIGMFGQDSLHYNLSFVTQSDTSSLIPDTILHVVNLRPETRLCSPALKDSVAVLAVYALGKYATNYTSYPITALIRNYADSQSYDVTLKVIDQATSILRYTSTQSISIRTDTVGLIEFNGWVPNLLETDSIIVCIPTTLGETVVSNNRNYYIQMVTNSIVSYDDRSMVVSEGGTDTMAGYTLSRHLLEGCGKINSVQVYLSGSALGHEIYAVAMDTNKVVLALSDPFIPDSSQIDRYHTFYFSDTARLMKNEEYYVGLGQAASAIPYFPVGVQYEAGRIRDSAYYRYHITNDSLFHQPIPGRLMINVEWVPGVPKATITGDLFLCTGTMDTLVASSIKAKYADSIIAFSSQTANGQFTAQEALGTPNVFPNYGSLGGAWVSKNDGGKEYLVMRFSNPDSINFIDIYETLNPGVLDSVYFIDDMGMYHLEFFDLASPAPAVARRNRITFPLTSYKVSGVRLAFDMDVVPGYSAIDAVCIGRITTPGSFTSIMWSGGGTVFGTNMDSIKVSAPGGYKLITTDINGCMTMDSVTVITPVLLTPVIMALDTSLCPGDSLKLKSSLTGGNLWNTGATTDSIFVSTPGYYWVTYDDGTGCGITIDSVTITLDTIPIVMITGDTVICPLGVTTLDAGIHPVYNWSNGEHTQTINVSDAGLYALEVIDGHGCKGYDTIATTIGILPVAMITGNLIYCSGDSTLLKATPGPAGYLWSTGATSDSIYVKTPGLYSVTVTDINGCTATSAMEEVTMSLPIFPMISALDTSFCPGDSVLLVSDQVGNNLWSTGASTNAIYVSVAGSYYVQYDDGSGCSSNMSNMITVTTDTIPVVQITGDTAICDGSTVMLNAGIHPAYLWSTGSTSSSISVGAPGTYSVMVTDGNGCKGSDTIVTTVSAIPAPVITGIFVVCPNDSTTLYAGPGLSYLWSTGATSDSIIVKTADVFSVTVTNLDGCTGNSAPVQTTFGVAPNLMITSLQGFCPMDSVKLDAGAGYVAYLWSTGETTQSIFVSAIGNYSVTVTAVNSCEATDDEDIVAYPPANAFISGTLSFCDIGSSTTLDAGLGYQSYLWSTGETTHSIVVTQTGNYSLMIVDQHGCSDTATVTVSLEGGLPAVPGPISGSGFGMCNVSTPSTYSIAPVPNSTCYIWHVPAGVTIVGGFMADSSVFGDSIQVIFDNTFTGGMIEVSAHNDCGASPTWMGSSLFVDAAPGSVPGAIAGQTAGICKQAAATYTLPPINDATGYLWTVPIGATIMSGQNTNSINVVFASSYRTGDICVQYSTQCGTSPFECVTVSPTPVINNNIQGSNVLCEFASNELYSIAPVNGANEYIWTVPTGASIVSGQGTPSIQVDFGSHSGIVTVRASNACGFSPIKFINVTLGKCSVIGGSGKVVRQLKNGDVSINIFPNPSEGILNIAFSTNGALGNLQDMIQVLDPLGRVVYQTMLQPTKGSTQRLDLRHLDKGMYFLNFKNGPNLYSSKIILR